eukprot:5141951-Amphidinium_carterae.1
MRPGGASSSTAARGDNSSSFLTAFQERSSASGAMDAHQMHRVHSDPDASLSPNFLAASL